MTTSVPRPGSIAGERLCCIPLEDVVGFQSCVDPAAAMGFSLPYRPAQLEIRAAHRRSISCGRSSLSLRISTVKAMLCEDFPQSGWSRF